MQNYQRVELNEQETSNAIEEDWGIATLETPAEVAVFLRNEFYDTPNSASEVWRWAQGLSDMGERDAAMTACGMAFNLAARYIEHDWDA